MIVLVLHVDALEGQTGRTGLLNSKQYRHSQISKSLHSPNHLSTPQGAYCVLHHSAFLTLTPGWRERPVESTLSVHVLPCLHLFVLAHSVVLIVARHLCVLGALESAKTHRLVHLPRLVIHVLWLRPLLLHLHIGRVVMRCRAGACI